MEVITSNMGTIFTQIFVLIQQHKPDQTAPELWAPVV